MQALNKLPTLQQRVGNRYLLDNVEYSNTIVHTNGFWGRMEGSRSEIEPHTSITGIKQSTTALIMQAGIDGEFYENERGKIIAGLTGQYGRATSDVSSKHGDGEISTNAWTLGVNGSWYGHKGFYVDAQAQVTRFDSDLYSQTGTRSLADNILTTGYALGIEVGQQITLQSNWSLTPQLQLSWSTIDAKQFVDTWKSNVKFTEANSLIGRVGLATGYHTSWTDTDGRTANVNFYGVANIYQEFIEDSRINVAGVGFTSSNDSTWGGFDGGGRYAWANNKYAVFGEGSINTSLNHFADSYSLKGNIGLKVNW